ncbi:MAG: SDR family oxidoreductase [Patescibacteria group bacterium]
MGLLDGRTILVTGVGRPGGIGTVTVDEIRNQGGTPIISCHPGYFERVNDRYRQGDELIIPCDFALEADVVEVITVLHERDIYLDGFLHSVANVPASMLNEGWDFLAMTTDEWIESLTLNALSFHWLTRYLMGSKPYLRLLNQGAVGVAMTFMPGAEKYIEFYAQMAGAKALLNSIALYLAGSVGKHGVRIHLLDAGPVKTLAAGGVKNFSSLYKAVPRAVPLGVNTEAKDVARHIAWLMSPYSVGSPLVHTVDHGLQDQGVMPVRDPRQQ